jgi:gamma-glutamylputrescine oxidase
MLSYWERESFISYDHIIIGAGIVGLSTAIEIRERFPSARILVLERGLLPTGASSRNAGFACMGSVTELLDDLQVMTESEVLYLFEQRKKGLDRLRKRLGDATIDYRENGSYELISEKEADAVEKLDYLNKLINPVTGKQPFRIANEKIADFGFSKNYVKTLIENTCEGELNTGKMLRSLTDLAFINGIEVKTGAEVKEFNETSSGVELGMGDHLRKEICLFSKTVTFCTNAFTGSLLPGEDVIPGRGQVLITNPIPDLKFKGIFHFDRGYYYFREIDGRVLFGGGRNIDFSAEQTTSFELTERIQNDLENKLKEIILPGVEYSVGQRWAGIMAFGKKKQPVVKAISDRLFGAFRMGGMGVALGGQVAMEVADLIAERH